MSRTKLRPSVTGEINLRTLLIVGILLLIIGLGFLALTTLNSCNSWIPWCIFLRCSIYDVDEEKNYLEH